jgi:hypothetical protein
MRRPIGADFALRQAPLEHKQPAQTGLVLDVRAPGPISGGMTTGTQVALPTGVTTEGDGIAIGETGVRVDAYIDFLCPFCRQFEAASGDSLKQMVAEQLITLGGRLPRGPQPRGAVRGAPRRLTSRASKP